MKETRPIKPLGGKSYGSIGHLPGSRRGPGDHGVHEGQYVICCVKPRDKHDYIIVQEKLDGSNVSVANVDGVFHALSRAGYPAVSSPYLQHKMFHDWFWRNASRFDFLRPGERLCGEWLAQAHGTRYTAIDCPFVPFDIMRNGHERALLAELQERTANRFLLPRLLTGGGPCSIQRAMELLGKGSYGAIDDAEGCVWRVERKGTVDFLAKYVRPSKVDGCYLPELTGEDPVWNWSMNAAQ